MVIDMYSCYVNNFSVAMEELKSTKAALSAFLTVRFDYMTYGERKKTVKHPSNKPFVHSWFASKIIWFYALFIQVISLTMGRMHDTWSSKSNGNDEFENNLPINRFNCILIKGLSRKKYLGGVGTPSIIWGTTTRILIIFGVPPHKYKYLKWPPPRK